MDNPLITVLTPCYNAEKDMQQYIDCILNQTYNNIELILINDGSTDKTEEIILNNKTDLENICSKFIYIKQNNQGIGATINNGLKYVSGKYLTWPDYDDILYPNYLEAKVSFLEANPDISIVLNPVDVVNEDNKSEIIDKYKRISNDDTHIMKDCIWCRNFVFAPISSCIRTEDFWIANHGNNIYPSRQGQNWQMVLPILYKNKAGYIKESLAKYVIRKNSHSRTHDKEFITRNIGLMKILFNTINNINMTKKEKLYYFYEIIIRFLIVFIREFFIRFFFIRQIKKQLKTSKIKENKNGRTKCTK